MIARINPLTNKIEGKDNFSRNRYVLVAVRSPDHHGLFVGDLAGGDGVDLLDVLDLGNGLHGDNFYVSAIYDEWSAYAFLKSFLENFSFFFLFFFARGVLCVRVKPCVAVIFSFFKTWLILGLSFLFSRERGIFFSFVLGTKTFEANFFGPLDEIGFRRKMPPQKNEEDVLNFVHYKRWS